MCSHQYLVRPRPLVEDVAGAGCGCGGVCLLQICTEGMYVGMDRCIVYMHDIAGAVTALMVVIVGGGGRGRPRSKLKTGWTLGRRRSQPDLQATQRGRPKLCASWCLGGSRAVGSGCVVADVRRCCQWKAGPQSALGSALSSVSINFDLGSQICTCQSNMRFCFRASLCCC